MTPGPQWEELPTIAGMPARFVYGDLHGCYRAIISVYPVELELYLRIDGKVKYSAHPHDQLEALKKMVEDLGDSK